MGDCGSYFLGFSIASLDILINQNSNQFLSFSPFLFIIGVPIIDMTYVIFMRIKEKKSPFFPDQRHIHYQLLNSGFSHNESVNIIYSLHGFLVSIALISKSFIFSLFLFLFSILLLFKSKKIRLKLKLLFKKV